MASITRQRLFAPQDVDNVAADTLLTVPSTDANTVLLNASVRFSNHTSGAVTIVAWAVPSGGSAGNTNICLPTTSIAANDFIDLVVPQIAAGGTLEAQSGAANSITAQPLDGYFYAP